jgi:hypothetical protein
MPAKTKETARIVVRKVVDELERRLAGRMQQAVSGSLIVLVVIDDLNGHKILIGGVPFAPIYSIICLSITPLFRKT